MEDAPQVVRILGCHLLRRLSAQRTGDNVFVCPYSVTVVVSLLMAGAQRSTEREMADALKAKVPQFHKSMRRLLVFPIAGCPSPEEEAHMFRMANRIFLGSTLPLADSFRKIGDRVYRTLVTSANFSTRAAEERIHMNTWVEATTGIRSAMPIACAPGPNTRIFLLTVVFLNAVWKHPFPRPTTLRRPFGNQGDVLTMANTAVYGYADIEELALSAVDVPLMSDAFSLTIILPTNGPIEDLCENLNSEVRYITPSRLCTIVAVGC